MKRKVYRIDKTGSIKNLNLIEEDLAEPKSNEVCVEVKSIGLNFADLFAIWGLYSATPKGSFIPGLEFAGVIIKKGSDVKDFEIGNKIIGLKRFGAYASHLNVESEYIFNLPNDWSFDDGTSLLVNSLTAYYALKVLGDIKINKTVLIHSAAGGVGIYANRIAKKFDAFTIGTIGRRSKFDLLKKEGYDEIIVRSKKFKQQLMESLGPYTLDIVLESIGGKIFEDSYSLLAPEGRLITYGSANFASADSRPNPLKLIFKYLTRPKIDPMKMINTNRAVMGFNLIWLWNKKNDLQKYFEEIQKLNLQKPIIGKTFLFEDLHKAINYLQSGKSVGKVVVRMYKS
ncbi:MAG: zinc-binding dehydrogenase [Ignavibacteriae bacterium]|nr:zinc-binding dehydrogenase [Ignavibacteriota bacterium]